ncbi:MAG: hypothetical protein R3F56_22270 [Planctomycetota bacterium]
MRRVATAWLLATLVLGIGLHVAVSTGIGIVANQQSMPYLDQWQSVHEARAVDQGTWRLVDLFRQHNEHRIAVPRLLFFLDTLVADQRGWFLVATTGAIQLAHASVLLWLLWRAGVRRPAMLVLAVGSLLGLLGAAVQMQNLVEPFQVQFPLVYLAATVAFAAGALAPHARRSRLVLATAIAAAAVGSFSMANGLGIWIVLFLLAARSGMSRRGLAVVVTAGLLVIGFYLHGFGWLHPYFTPTHGHAEVAPVRRPDRMALFFLALLGGPSRLPDGLGRPLLCAAAGVLGLAAFAAASRQAWPRARSGAHAARQAMVAVGVFVLLSASLTAYGRAGSDLVEAIGPRYETPSVVFWASSTLLAVAMAPSRVRTLALSLAALVLVSIAVANPVFVRSDSYFRDRLRGVASGLLAGVQDVERMRDLAANADTVYSELVPFLREHRLSVFAGQRDVVGRGLHEVGTIAGDGVGAVDTVELCPESGWGFYAQGWAFVDGIGRAPARVLFANETGTVLGHGIMDACRPDVAAAHPLVSDQRIGFQGYGSVDAPEGRFWIWAQLADGRLFRVPQPHTVAGVELAAAPGHPIADLSVHLTGQFGASTDGQGRDVGGAIATCDAGAKGAIAIGPISLPEDASLVLPVATGCGFGVRIALLEPTTGNVLVQLRPPATHGAWRIWRCPLPAAARGVGVLVVAVDDGIQADQWLSIGAPTWAGGAADARAPRESGEVAPRQGR